MKSEAYIKKVDGMICPQCEDDIAQSLIHMRGVLTADASYRKSQVTAEYDPAIIAPEAIDKRLSDIGYPVGTGRSGIISDLAGLLSVIVLYFSVPALTGLVNVPSLENGAGFGMLFIIGMLTGVHCIGMCGGIMLSQRSALVYNGARLLSYTVAGAVFGALGTALRFDTQFKSMVFTLSGLLVVIMGLMMWGVPFLRRISPQLVKPCRFRGGPALVGLFTGFMPCGALSSMWIFAASSGSAAAGACSMFSFGLGTCVFMLIFGLFGVLVPRRFNKYILKAATVFIVAAGLLLMTRGLRLL